MTKEPVSITIGVIASQLAIWLMLVYAILY